MVQDQLTIIVTEEEKRQYKNICNNNGETIKNNLISYIKDFTNYQDNNARINITIKPELKRALKSECLENNMTIQALLTNYIKETIKQG